MQLSARAGLSDAEGRSSAWLHRVRSSCSIDAWICFYLDSQTVELSDVGPLYVSPVIATQHVRSHSTRLVANGSACAPRATHSRFFVISLTSSNNHKSVMFSL